MAGPPERAEEAGPGERPLARDERRDRRHVVGVEGVPEAQEQAEPECGGQGDVHREFLLRGASAAEGLGGDDDARQGDHGRGGRRGASGARAGPRLRPG